MPIYEYRRPDGTTFEVMQKFSDAPLTEDPETGVPVQRVLTAPAIHFKGSGFHNTDYGTRKRNREKESSKGEGSSGGGDGGSGGGGKKDGGSSSSSDSSGGGSSPSGSDAPRAA
jgi:putative FmdB family regulatory protein